MEQHDAAMRVDAAGAVGGKNVKMRNRRIWHFFHIAAVVYMTVVVIAGFWPSYFGQLFGDFPVRNPIIHMHAVIFTGWLLLLLAQVLLVAGGNTKFHRKLGVAGALYGILIVLTGLAATLVLPVEKIGSGEWTLDQAASFLILPLGDLLIFSAFFGAAIWFRKKSEIHRRLILVASVMLVFPAAARIYGESSIPALLLLWLFPLVAAMILDGMLNRKVHMAYLSGLIVMLLSVGRVAVWETEAWLDFGRWLLGFVV
jgi:hypothetical protein